jgi:hypothetical protein
VTVRFERVKCVLLDGQGRDSVVLVGVFVVVVVVIVKGKCVPLHAMEAHGGIGGIAPTHT